MINLSAMTMHSLSVATIWLQAALAISFGAWVHPLVKFGLNAGLEGRMREVRG